jgi:hypothetical protein
LFSGVTETRELSADAFEEAVRQIRTRPTDSNNLSSNSTYFPSSLEISRGGIVSMIHIEHYSAEIPMMEELIADQEEVNP